MTVVGGPNTRAAERDYVRTLNRLAVNIAEIVQAYDLINDESALARAQQALTSYKNALYGWAEVAGDRMVRAVERKERRYWNELSDDMGRGLRNLFNSADMKPAMDQMVAEQVEYITSLPDVAAERAARLSINARVGGQRADQMADELARTQEVTKSRTTLIARTEVVRTSARLTEARCNAIGIEEYVWRTADDPDVRPGHAEVANKVFRWSDPPGINEGTKEKPRIMHHHPGEIWNCRCYAEPIIPE